VESFTCFCQFKGKAKTIKILAKINSDFTTFKWKGNLAYFILLLQIIDQV